MTKNVNFSSLVKAPSLTIEIDGVKHPVRKMTVGEYLNFLQRQQDMKVGGDLAAEAKEGIDFVMRSIPTLDEKFVLGLDFGTVTKLGKLIGQLNEGIFDEKEDEGNAPAAK